MAEQVRKMPAMAKLAMRFQAFMLRRNWMGKMSNFVMVITVKGRKSGTPYSTPVGYIYDGSDLIGLSGAENGGSNWYKNAIANGEVLLNIKGNDVRAKATAITDPAELARLRDLYKSVVAPTTFPRLFGVAADAPDAEIQAAFAKRVFVRFTPL